MVWHSPACRCHYSRQWETFLWLNIAPCSCMSVCLSVCLRVCVNARQSCLSKTSDGVGTLTYFRAIISHNVTEKLPPSLKSNQSVPASISPSEADTSRQDKSPNATVVCVVVAVLRITWGGITLDTLKAVFLKMEVDGPFLVFGWKWPQGSPWGAIWRGGKKKE